MSPVLFFQGIFEKIHLLLRGQFLRYRRLHCRRNIRRTARRQSGGGDATARSTLFPVWPGLARLPWITHNDRNLTSTLSAVTPLVSSQPNLSVGDREQG
ncbi:MAG: hypothetical protein EXS36_01275 [Pedosphaera sp.]|nr:hypothetical protein [Pedosphaera sp.]